MTADNQSDIADKTAGETTNPQTNPQSPGGAAQAGLDAPVFVSGVREFFKGPHAAINGGGDLVFRSKHRGWLRCFGFALLYMLLFVFTGRWLPQLHQAWLDFCLPLTEYIGGLTPRADRIMGQLTENGLPERADDALHAIAMAKILMFPVFVCMLGGALAAAHPSRVFVYCTWWTRIKFWIRISIGLAMAFALAMLFVYMLEIRAGEGFDDTSRDSGFLAKHGAYRNGNFAMFGDLGVWFVMSMFLWGGAIGIAGIRPFRFVMVKQKPDDVQDFAAFMARRKKAADENSADNADTADKEESPQN